MNDTSQNAQDTASKAEEPTAGGVANGAKPADASTAAGNADPKAGDVSLESQLNVAQAKANEYLEGWQRARAEFVNYKKRADKERDDAYQNGVIDTFRKLLPVVDDFDRAIANVPPEMANTDVIKGFVLIHRKLLGLLESAGIKVLNPVGEPFNPAFHEAIGQDETSNVPSGHVSTVLQKGYVYGDKVLRPALIRVAA
jgi:molecular chaperone GrpE